MIRWRAKPPRPSSRSSTHADAAADVVATRHHRSAGRACRASWRMLVLVVGVRRHGRCGRGLRRERAAGHRVTRTRCSTAATCCTSATRATDFGQNDDKMTGYEDCAQQRNLTDRGRADARAIGAAIRRAAHPGRRRCSRARSAARAKPRELVFGRATHRCARARRPCADRRCASATRALRTLLSTPVPPGDNLAIVSHGNPFHALAGRAVSRRRRDGGRRAAGRDDGASGSSRRFAPNGWDALR